MDAATAQHISDAFMHGFSAGMAFAVFCLGLYGLLTRRRDP